MHTELGRHLDSEITCAPPGVVGRGARDSDNSDGFQWPDKSDDVNLPEETQLGTCSRGEDRHSNFEGTSGSDIIATREILVAYG